MELKFLDYQTKAYRLRCIVWIPTENEICNMRLLYSKMELLKVKYLFLRCNYHSVLLGGRNCGLVVLYSSRWTRLSMDIDGIRFVSWAILGPFLWIMNKQRICYHKGTEGYEALFGITKDPEKQIIDKYCWWWFI